jgi:hypothetical protein
MLAALLLALAAPAAASSTAPPAAGREAPRTRILVLDLAGETLGKEEAGVLRDSLVAELSKRKGIEVLSSEDVRRVLDVEAQRQATGCEGESDCLAEIGAALGADRVLYGTVGRLGSLYVVNLSVIDPTDARAFGRDSFQADSLEAVGRQLPAAAERLFGQWRKRGKVERGAPVVTILGGTALGAGLLATAGFGVTTFVLAEALQNPQADRATRELALEQGPNFLTATAVSGAVLGLGAVVTLVGLAVE